jgi:lysophospholipase L1-like esterase
MLMAALALALAASPLATAAGGQDGANFLAADLSQAGAINLAFHGAPGARVAFSEQRGGRSIPLGMATVGAQDFAVLLRAATWRCSPRTRAFRALATAADGTTATGSFTARTPSCADRLGVAIRRVGGRPGRLRVLLRDTWGLGGLVAQVCAAPAAAPVRCHVVTFARRRTVVTREVALGGPGRWRAEVRIGGHTFERLTGDAAADTRPVLLATGDSTIQGVDGYLADRLGARVRVRGESHAGTGISHVTAAFDWQRVARAQAAAVRPLATVVSIGANDGFDMSTPSGSSAPCCGTAWTLEYARRARAMMLAYGRHGAARTLWLELPVPRASALAVVTAAVNRAVAMAASRTPTARVVPLASLLSPGGRFSAYITVHGRRLRVRQADGIHLAPAGAALAADAALAALRAAPPPHPPGLPSPFG